MVTGLELFTAYFREFEDRYVLIGGAACSVLMEEVGLDFRTTKDLDIVLCVEALDGKFVKTFWEFIRLGGYQNQQISTGKKIFYRFDHPTNTAYPFMLELFSRIPDMLAIPSGSHLTPIHVADEVSSLSAILLNEDYYHLILNGKRIINGSPIVGPEYLIPLKAYAWLQSTRLQAEGALIQSGNIKKHRNDVFRLYVLLSTTTRITLPPTVREDFWRFLQQVEEEQAVVPATFGIRGATLAEVCSTLRKIYGNNDNDHIVKDNTG